MSDTVIVGLLSLAGTVLGSAAGILAANRLVLFRLEQLEKKVDKHNGLVERMAVAESRLSAGDEALSGMDARLRRLEVR